jgi:predicted anti-sigma-YlaC factor YlaD
VNCDIAQEQLGQLIDTELVESAQAGLFQHLEGCAGCRGFLDSMLRLRRAAGSDREAILRDAAEALPRLAPRPVPIRRAGASLRPWIQAITRGWRMPAPVGVALALFLVFAGAVLGSRLDLFPRGSLSERAQRMARPEVVVVCGLPEVEVVGSGGQR